MPMHLSGSETILAKAMEDMEKNFAATSSVWRDHARDEFEKIHLDEMRESVRNARYAMRNIEELLRQVVKECS
jgi:hypothetical protein